MRDQIVNGAENIKPQAMTLNAVHPEYANFSASEIEEKAKAKLREYIAEGQKRALLALRRIETEVPADSIVPIAQVRFAANDRGELLMNAGKAWSGRGVHRHALGQFAQRVGFPIKLMNELRGRGDWGNKLAAHNLNELAEHGSADEDKVLVRAVDGQVRGVLTASYRTDDSRPAVDAILQIAREVNAVVANGSALDTRCSLKVMKADPIEIYPGEWAVIGFDYRTSDYGNGARELMGWILRLLCINGAVVTTSFRRVHLGGRITSDVEFSNRTKRLNEQYTVSATRDMARMLLGPAAIDKMVAQIRAANAAELKGDDALAVLKKNVNKKEQEMIVAKYNSPDVELLPAGNTAWRFSNAISWLANQVEDADRKLDLEQLAGQVIEDAQPKAA